jgi:hypothetical protein
MFSKGRYLALRYKMKKGTVLTASDLLYIDQTASQAEEAFDRGETKFFATVPASLGCSAKEWFARLQYEVEGRQKGFHVEERIPTKKLLP